MGDATMGKALFSRLSGATPHHCRFCGLSLCEKCTRHSVNYWDSSKAKLHRNQRSCKFCYEAIKAMNSHLDYLEVVAPSNECIQWGGKTTSCTSRAAEWNPFKGYWKRFLTERRESPQKKSSIATQKLLEALERKEEAHR